MRFVSQEACNKTQLPTHTVICTMKHIQHTQNCNNRVRHCIEHTNDPQYESGASVLSEKITIQNGLVTDEDNRCDLQ